MQNSELRQTYGEKFHIVECEDRIEHVPIGDNPVQAVRNESGDAPDRKSREEIQQGAFRRAKQGGEDNIAQAKQVAEGTIR